MNAKNLEIEEERQEQWNPTSTAWNFFFFHENFPKYIQKHSLQFLFYAVFVFPEYCKGGYFNVGYILTRGVKTLKYDPR